MINYNTQKEYDTFLENTQRVSLKLNKVLKQGYFKFPVKMDKTDDCCLEMPEDEMNIAIPVIRKDNKNFINVKNKQYPIKNIQSLFKLQYPNGRTMWHYEGSYLQRTIVQLHKAVNGITSDDIGILISDGVKEYRKQLNKEQKELKKRIAKSKEFIAHAVKLTNAVKVDKGYFVYGISKIKYFVAEDDLGVWTVKNNKQDKYLCIIDIDTDTDNQAGKNDAIAKRLLMLSKDKVVASEIFQNGDRMDSHWLEIQDNPETNSGKPY